MRTLLAVDSILAYLDKPDTDRPVARYQGERLDDREFFSEEQLQRLDRLVQGVETPRSSGHGLSKFLIDFAWASSKLEGNTYTELETKSLLQFGTVSKDKPAEDAAMVINHRRAIELMLARPDIEFDQLLAIHKALADDTDAPGSRHFLEVGKRGVIRSYTPDGLHITGTSYLPPQAEGRPPGFLEDEARRAITHARSIDHPVQQAFYVMTRLPYLQPFYDANKRTSRVLANAPLIANDYAPLSFVDFDKTAYLRGLVAFYELGDEQLFGQAFVRAYVGSAIRYRSLPESVRVQLTLDRDRFLDQATNFVLTGEDELAVELALAPASSTNRPR
ncbi:Fic family protein [Pseudoxanthomonas sp. LjRoot168]|uniref:Fic family protein n=1 Tax=unclassified Pseudoxanthomonas TaxID=2645906 RepID=UPI003ED05A49